MTQIQAPCEQSEYHSAQAGHHSVVLTLLTIGLDSNTRVLNNETALMLAAKKGHLTLPVSRHSM